MGCASSKSASPALETSAVAVHVNDFGLSLLSAVYTGIGGNNVFISPISIVSALGMVLLGATPDGKAEQELQAAFGLNKDSAPSFLSGLRKVATDLMTLENGVQFLNANSVWCQSSIKKAYVRAVGDMFNAEAKLLPDTPDPINLWCSKATKGMIPTILDQLDPLTVAVLVNAVYFKGTWKIQFDAKTSMRGTFGSGSGGDVPCAMMTRTDKRMLYTEDSGMQIVELPYGADAKLAATVLLPPRGEDALGKLLTDLTAEGGSVKLARYLSNLKGTNVKLLLPRFKLEFGVHDLKSELVSAFGIKEAFEGKRGFQAMSDDPDVRLSKVMHKAIVEVNEEGTKAAAVTAGVMMTRSMPMMQDPPISVKVDRPFIFLIRDPITGVLLFAGIVKDPELDTTGV